jgi:16S rRNA (uracil1498-N3)-methyltransferase
MGPRIFSQQPLGEGLELELDDKAAKHIQVLRMQPSQALTLFDGQGGQFEAHVVAMHKAGVRVLVGTHQPVEREPSHAVHLVVGMPANERMDWLVEKATELGVASITPLHTERTVVRLKEDRAAKRREHWQSITISACEQSGRNRVPVIQPVQNLAAWLAHRDAWDAQATYRVLSFHGEPLMAALASPQVPTGNHATYILVGPEGGLSPAEEALAVDHGMIATSLGDRVLRAETAALTALACATYGLGYSR